MSTDPSHQSLDRDSPVFKHGVLYTRTPWFRQPSQTEPCFRRATNKGIKRRPDQFITKRLFTHTESAKLAVYIRRLYSLFGGYIRRIQIV